jgi:hypothetical protein
VKQRKIACRHGQGCILKDVEDECCTYNHDVASAKVQTCSLSSKSFDNIMNIDKTQQKR